MTYTYCSETNFASRLSANGHDAILVRALMRLTDSLAQGAQPIREGPEHIHKLLTSAVSYTTNLHLLSISLFKKHPKFLIPFSELL